MGVVYYFQVVASRKIGHSSRFTEKTLAAINTIGNSSKNLQILDCFKF